MPYINQFLQDQSFSIEANEVNRTQIIAEVINFASEDEILFRKMKKGIMASYIDFQFRGNLMQRMHDQYEYLSYANLVNVLES